MEAQIKIGKEVKIMNSCLSELNDIDSVWNYSDLSILSSNHGGPEKLITDIFSDGYENGFNDGYPIGYDDGYNDGANSILGVVIPVAIVAATALITWGTYIWQKQKKRKKEINRLIEENAKLKAENYVQKIKMEKEPNDTNSI